MDNVIRVTLSYHFDSTHPLYFSVATWRHSPVDPYVEYYSLYSEAYMCYLRAGGKEFSREPGTIYTYGCWDDDGTRTGRKTLLTWIPPEPKRVTITMLGYDEHTPGWYVAQHTGGPVMTVRNFGHLVDEAKLCHAALKQGGTYDAYGILPRSVPVDVWWGQMQRKTR